MKLKDLLTVIFTIVIVSTPLLLRGETGDSTETFLLRCDCPVRVSIENGWERNGWTPVVLAVGNLELYFRMNKAGEVSGEGWHVDLDAGEIRVGSSNFPFTIYEQNPVRTRVRLINRNEPVLLEIHREKKQGVLYIGSSRWRLDYLRVRLEEAGPGGLYRLIFGGRAVYTHKRLFLEPASGAIYAVRHSRRPVDFDMNEPLVWAIKVQEELKGINQGGCK